MLCLLFCFYKRWLYPGRGNGRGVGVGLELGCHVNINTFNHLSLNPDLLHAMSYCTYFGRSRPLSQMKKLIFNWRPSITSILS